MRKLERLLSLALVVMIFAVLPLNVAAADAVETKSTSEYGTLRGTIHQTSSTELNILVTAGVSSNTTNAYLLVKTEVQNAKGTTLAAGSNRSAAGATTLSRTYYFSVTDAVPYVAFGTSEIRGTVSYAVYTKTSVSIASST